MPCKYRKSKYTRRKYSRASNPPAITLVKTKRGMQMFEPTPRYDVMLFGKFYFQLYYNMRGYVGYLPTPDGLKLDIGEHGIGVFRKEIAKLNREWAQKRVDDKDAQWLKGSNPRRSLVPKSRKTPKWLIEAVKSSLRKQKRPKKYPRGQGYNDLAIVPAIIAQTVTERPYTGREISTRNRDSRLVERVEGQRRNMSRDTQRAFVRWVDAKCRAAYKAKAPWFMKIARSRTNAGRDQLYAFVSHWLAGYLTGGRR